MSLFKRIFSREKKETLDKGLEKTKQSVFTKLSRAIAGKTPEQIRAMKKEEVAHPVTKEDFAQALRRVQPSVSDKDIAKHEQWKAEFGSG